MDEYDDKHDLAAFYNPSARVSPATIMKIGDLVFLSTWQYSKGNSSIAFRQHQNYLQGAMVQRSILC